MHRFIRFAVISNCSRIAYRSALYTSRSAQATKPPEAHSVLHRKRRVQAWRQAKMSVRDVQKIIKTYQPGQFLRPTHFAQVSALLIRHPLKNSILNGRETAAAIRVVRHPAYKDDKNLCFAAVRFDKSECIFSYKLCLRGSHPSGIWYIFQQACRNELDHRGILRQLKDNNASFRKENPGFQMEFQFDRLMQDFSDRKQLVVTNEKQLLRLVGRNETLHWRLLSQDLAAELTKFAIDSFNDPNSIYIKVEQMHEMRRTASLKQSQTTQDATESATMKPTQQFETALNTEGVQETEQVLDAEQAKEVETALKPEQALDTEQALGTEQAKEAETALKTEQALDAEQALDTEQAKEVKTALTTEQALDAEQAKEAETTPETEQVKEEIETPLKTEQAQEVQDMPKYESSHESEEVEKVQTAGQDQ